MYDSLTVIRHTTNLMHKAQLSSHSGRTIPVKLEDIKISSQVFFMHVIAVINACIHVGKVGKTCFSTLHGIHYTTASSYAAESVTA